MEGTLCIRVFLHDRLVDEVTLVEEWTGSNLLVNNMKTMLAHLVAGEVIDRPITRIGFGTNGTAAIPSDTSLTGMYARAIGAHTYPSSSSVQFAWQLGKSEANAMAISEFGLLSSNNGLYARRARPVAINKTSDMSLSGTWGISF